MDLAPTDSERRILDDIWASQAKTPGRPVDFTRPLALFPPDAPPVGADEAAKVVIDALGWPQWVVFFEKPPQAMIAAGRWAARSGRPKGVCWMAPGTGAPFDPPSGPPGVFILRADWAPSDQAVLDAAAEARRQGGLLVVDESATGFRLSRGGAAAAHGLEPDAVLHAHTFADGRRLALLAGRGDAPRDLPRKGPGEDLLGLETALWRRAAEIDASMAVAALGRAFALGLEYYRDKAWLTDELTLEGPAAMPRLSGRRLWAFVKLAAEEGLFFEPLVLFNAETDPEDMTGLVWPRLARAAARLRVLPEGEMAPKGWKEAAPTKCIRVEEILRSLD